MDEREQTYKNKFQALDDKTSSRMKSYAEYLIHHQDDRGKNVWQTKFVDERKRQEEKQYNEKLQKLGRDKRANFEYMKQAYDSEIRNKVPTKQELENALKQRLNKT